MNITTEDYSVISDDTQNKITFSGSLRLFNLKEYEPIKKIMFDVHNKSTDSMTLDFKELKYLNSSGITAVSAFVISARKENKLKLTVLGSKQISWQEKSLQNLNKLWNEVVIDMQ